ncbi:DUF1905 domain-containing protein [Subtercola sp. YIM 133946]|uniref:DUF1905 domain-containing protein n=1 Tax=Subtercola sp. YIM 133946 TaxID=3118909 RepID=UPI002F93480F
MKLQFRGDLWYWRGPAPYHFVTVPEPECDLIHQVAPLVTYGWGMVPVALRIGRTETTTALWPKDGGYIVPVKRVVQLREDLDVGSLVEVHLHIDA